MSQLQRFKAAKAIRRIKPVPPHKTRRLVRELQEDIDIALQYAALIDRATAHNVTTCAFAPRASPAIH